MSVCSSFNGDAFQTNDSSRQITPRCLKMLDRQVYDELLAVSLDRCRGDRDTASSDALLKLSLALSRSLDRRQDTAAALQMSNNELRLYQTRMNDLAGSGGLDPRSVSIGRYKTERCRPFEETGQCKYGDKCQFAHGDHELRMLSRHPKYKTELCRTFHTVGFCPYGPRCHFVHRSDTSVRAHLAERQLRNESAQLSRARCTSESQLFCPSGSSSNSPIYVSSEIGAITVAAARNAIARLLNENNGGALRSAGDSTWNGAVNEGGYGDERVLNLGHQLPRGCRSASKDGDNSSLIAQLLSQLRLDGASLSSGGGLSTLYDAVTPPNLMPAGYPMFDVPFGAVNGHYGAHQ